MQHKKEEFFKKIMVCINGYYEKNGINQCVEALKLQKPCLFSSKKIKVEFREKKKKYSKEIKL